MKEKDDLNNLLKKLKENSLTHSETAYLLEYLKNIEPGPEMESILRKEWDSSSEVNQETDPKWLYNQIISRINFNEDIEHEQGQMVANGQLRLRNFKKILIPLLRYAAVFVLGCAFFWLIRPVPVTERLLSSADTGQFQQIIVPYGSKSRVVLPDGSVVTLNSGSNLSYYSDGFSSGKRSVILTGEGYFEVQKDSSRPFYVNTPGIKVKVLGTTFNMKAYPDENTEEMLLITGSVEIYLATDINEERKPVLLKPNEKALFIKTEKQIRRQEYITEELSLQRVKLQDVKFQTDANTEQIVSWKDDRLIFDNEPFSSLIAKIERWYDVRITMNYPELSKARFTGKFDKETVEMVLNALTQITPFQYEIRKNQITITKQ